MFGSIIVAGGRSTRMGQDKAFLPFGDRCLLQIVIDAVFEVTDQIVIALSNEQGLPKIQPEQTDKISFSRDKIPMVGPLQGIADAVTELRPEIEKVVILTCDLPYLTSQWISSLQNRLTDEWDVVCCEQDSHPNALLAVYRKEILATAQELLNQNRIRAKDLLRRDKVLRIPVDSDGTGSPPDEDMDDLAGYRRALCRFGFCDAAKPAVEIEILQNQHAGLLLPIHAASLLEALSVAKNIAPDFFGTRQPSKISIGSQNVNGLSDAGLEKGERIRVEL